MTCKKIETILVKIVEVKTKSKTVCAIDRDDCDGEDKNCPYRECVQQKKNNNKESIGDYMCGFQCDSCFHKQVCSDEPNTRALNEECERYANVKKLTDVQQLQAKIRAIADRLEISYRTADPMAVNNAVNELRELSDVYQPL
jgi:hypothetical protein